MKNKIKAFYNKHAKTITLGATVICTAGVAAVWYNVGRKFAISEYAPYDAGWYVKDLIPVTKDLGKFDGYAAADKWFAIHDKAKKDGVDFVKLTDIKELIDELISNGIADPDGDTKFLLLPQFKK